jgi:hypothetical protein
MSLSNVTINGYRLTRSELRTLDELRDYLMRMGCDSWATPTTSPKGNGYGFDVYEIWGRSNQATAHRRNVAKLYQLGVLRASEIDYEDGSYRLKLTESEVPDVKLQIESTDKVVTLNGVPARLWEGMTPSGIPVVAFITRVAVPDGHPTEQFERELQEHAPPKPELAGAFDARLIL